MEIVFRRCQEGAVVDDVTLKNDTAATIRVVLCVTDETFPFKSSSAQMPNRGLLSTYSISQAWSYSLVHDHVSIFALAVVELVVYVRLETVSNFPCQY